MGLTLHPHSHSHGHSHGKKKKKVEVDCEKLLVNSEDIQRSNGYQSYGSLPSQPASSHTEGHSHKDNINVKAAFVHVVGDLLQSIGVFVAALIIYFKVCLFHSRESHFLFVLLLYIPSQRLWSWRDGHFTEPHFFLGNFEQAVNQYFVHILLLVTDNNPS